MATPTGGMMGFDADARPTTEDFELGTTFIGDDGFVWVFVQANGAIAASQVDITVSAAFQASDGAGALANTAVAFVDNEYGWVRTNIPLVNGADA